MAEQIRGLNGVSEELQYGVGGSKLKSVSDGVFQITAKDGTTLAKMRAAEGTASDHVITKAQLDAILDSPPALLATLNSLAAALGDDENYAASMATLLAEVNQDVTDIVAALEIAENASHLGTFTGSTVGDNLGLRAIIQALITAVELRATIADPTFTGTVGMSHLRSQGAHLLFQTDTNEFKFKLNDVEAWQGTKTSTANTMRFVAFGSNTDGIHEFMGTLKNDGNFETNGNITVGGTVDGRNVASDGQALYNSLDRDISLTHSNAGSQTNFGDVIPSGANLHTLLVNITQAFDDGATLKVGKVGDDDYVATIDLAVANRQSTNCFEILSADFQPTYTITGSPTAGAVQVAITTSA